MSQRLRTMPTRDAPEAKTPRPYWEAAHRNAPWSKLMTQQEIANHLGVSRQAVFLTERRAIVKLRRGLIRILHEEGYL